MGHGDIMRLSGGKYTGNSHDVQWSTSNEDAIWVSPSSTNDSVLVMRDVDTGDDYYHVKVDGSGFPSGFSQQDLNKFQLHDNETVAIQVWHELDFVPKRVLFAQPGGKTSCSTAIGCGPE